MLAGGRSTRMGRDKGLCLLDGKPLASYGLDTLQQVCDEILISANEPGYEAFGFAVVKDKYSGIGPIAGIFTSLSASKTTHNIIISCDMPMLNKSLLKLLVDESPGYDAVVPFFNGLPEPLAAYYRRDVRDVFHESILEGRYKLQEALSRIKTKRIDVAGESRQLPKDMFLNLNTMSDLESLEGRLQKPPGGAEGSGQ